ncbi:MAG: hypothetical protein JNM43_21035 [Planctomycetaceae bacterium]|nr:hypothetical protein [Planctomycetaceae bacterium]
MAFHPQRFIHAANLRLDVPVSVHTSETLSDELRMAFEDATLFAFDEVIEGCIKRDVDFLLLSGNVFVEADRSLRARLALLKGCRRLEEYGIHVFVLPGDADPPEAWRAIPELPENVTVCYSSSPEPMELYLNDELATTVSASIWFGEADDFGIQVLAKGGEGVQPFRIGVVSKAKYEEARRMAAMAASASDEVLSSSLPNLASGEKVEDAGSNAAGSADVNEESTTVWRSIDAEDGERPRKLGGSSPRRIQRSLETLEAGPADSHPSLDPGFMSYVDEMMHEGQLNFLALTGEMSRTTLWREGGVVHCPGTTQPRSQMEASGGACSLVEVSASGEVRISPLDTSCVDWKQIEVQVEGSTTLSSMLQQMKTRLIELKPGVSDRIWSVQWILRGALPVLQMLTRSDLEVAATVELDELNHSGRTIRLLHDIRTIPSSWPVGDPPTALADQYQLFITRSRLLSDDSLQSMIDGDDDLTTGWKQRLTSLLPSLDPEQILARMRTDGAGWFEPNYGVELEEELPQSPDDLILSDDQAETLRADESDEAYDEEEDTEE